MKSPKENKENIEMFTILSKNCEEDNIEKIETIHFIPEESDDTDISNILSTMDCNTTVNKRDYSKEEIIHIMKRKSSFYSPNLTPKKVTRNLSNSEVYFNPRPVFLCKNKSFFK
jgi:hypothetical protein